MYKLNDISIEYFGLTAGRASGSNIAISGCWDMPSRIGKTHHDWKDENGVEPYLRADEIFFAGRDISLFCWLNEADRSTFISKIQQLYDYIDTLQGSTFPLSSTYGTWNVQLIDVVNVNYLVNGWGNIELKFRQPVVSMNGLFPTVQNQGVGIDGYNFNQLGLIKKFTTNQANRSATKQLDTTSYGFESIGSVKRGMREFSIEFYLKHLTIEDFNSCIQNLMYLLSRPNSRILRLDDHTTREFFVKDGFKVTNVRKNDDEITAFLTLQIAEIKMLQNWNTLTDSTGLILVDKHGVPLTEILKGF